MDALHVAVEATRRRVLQSLGIERAEPYEGPRAPAPPASPPSGDLAPRAPNSFALESERKMLLAEVAAMREWSRELCTHAQRVRERCLEFRRARGDGMAPNPPGSDGSGAET